MVATTPSTLLRLHDYRSMTLKSTVALSLCRYSRRRRSSSADRAFDPSSLSLSFFPDTAETRACLSVSESDDDEDRSTRRRFRRLSSFLRSFAFFFDFFLFSSFRVLDFFEPFSFFSFLRRRQEALELELELESYALESEASPGAETLFRLAAIACSSSMCASRALEAGPLSPSPPPRGASPLTIQWFFPSSTSARFQSCTGALAMAAVARSRPFANPALASVVAGMKLLLFPTLHILAPAPRMSGVAEGPLSKLPPKRFPKVVVKLDDA